MHICACNSTNYLPVIGGAELGLHSTLLRLARVTEHRFSVITSTRQLELPRREDIDGIEVHRYVAPRIGAWGYVSSVACYQPIRRLLSLLQPDLVLINYLLPFGLAAWRMAHKMKLPFVLALGGKDIYDPFDPPPRLLRRMARYCIRRSPLIIAYSSFVERRLINRFGARPGTIRRIPYGVDLERFHGAPGGHDARRHDIRRRYGLSSDQVVVLAVQRLVERKGVDVLLKAFARIADDAPEALMLVGGKGPDHKRLRGLCGELGLGERVRFCGFITEEEKPAYFAAADVFAMHSHYEGLGIVLEEASASERPVITTHSGGTTDVVESEVTGLLVAPGDVEALAAALRRLIAEPQLRRAMGERGRQRMVEHFSLKSVADRYLETFAEAWRL